MNTKDFNSLSGKLGINIDDEWTRSLVHTELANKAESGDTNSLYKLVQLARFSRQLEIREFAAAEIERLGFKNLLGSVAKSVKGSLQDAYDNVSDGDTLKLEGNAGVVRATSGKNFTIDLNGQTLHDPEDTNGDGVIYAKSGVINMAGEGIVDGRNATDWAMAVWACGDATVNISGGTYTNVDAGDDTQYDLMYVSQNGTLNIYGGEFKSQTPKWTLNVNDGAFKNDTAHINVYGGRFYQFDPSKAETEVTNPFSFVAEGYHVVQDGDWYEVVKD